MNVQKSYQVPRTNSLVKELMKRGWLYWKKLRRITNEELEKCLLHFFNSQAKELCLRVFARYPEFSGGAEMSSFELLSDPKYCGKMKVMERLLRVFREEHSKLLVFSRSTQVCIM